MENVETPIKQTKFVNLRGKLRSIFGRNIDSKPEKPTPVSLKNFLTRITQGEKFAPEEFPSAFDLGEFGKEADKLNRAAQADPEYREYISKAVTSPRGNIFFISTNRGEATEVSAPTPVPGENDLLIIHTHPLDTPFSPQDLDSLFTRPNWKGWTMPAQMVVTQTLKVLIFRTGQPPELPRGERWRPKMDMIEEPTMAEEVFSSKSDIEVPNNLGSISHKRMYALTRIAQKYHLKIYSCPINKNVVSVAA